MLWMGLVSQAGVAIGLVTVAAEVYPAVGGDMRTILLSVIAVNETIGAVLFRRALVRSGEANSATASPSLRVHQGIPPGAGSAPVAGR
jgi:hypothetical protein